MVCVLIAVSELPRNVSCELVLTCHPILCNCYKVILMMNKCELLLLPHNTKAEVQRIACSVFSIEPLYSVTIKKNIYPNCALQAESSYLMGYSCVPSGGHWQSFRGQPSGHLPYNRNTLHVFSVL